MTTTYLSYRLAAADIPGSIARISKDPPVAREVAYWNDHIDKVADIESFVGDKRLFAFAMKAFGLSDMGYAKAFMTKMLKEGVSSPTAMANKLSDQRYRDFAKTFDFNTYGSVTTSLSAARTGVVDRYLRQTLEENTGAQSQGARLALYFQRKASSIASPMGILADAALLKVTQVALGLPETMSLAPLDNQVAMIKARLDVSTFKDPAKVDAFLKRFCAMNDLATGASASPSPAVMLSQASGQGFSVDALMAVAKLRTGGLRMQSGLHVGVSAQIALRDRLETIAHNLANVNTPGFRAEQAKFDAAVARVGAQTPVAFVEAQEPYLSREAGGAIKTDSPLDVAVQGDAFMALETPQGTIYTRDGRLFMTPTGALVSVNGHAVLDAGGAPLQLDPAGAPPVIGRDGMIVQGERRVGAIGLFAIDPAARLSRADNSGVVPDRPPTAVLDFGRNGLLQGHLENANVSGVTEIARLVAVQRAFENVVAAQGHSEQSFVDAIKTLGGAGA